MILVPQIRRSTWSCDGIEVRSTITCSSRSIIHVVERANGYLPRYTVEVFYGSRVARVRDVPNAEALAWERYIAVQVLAELGAIT